MYKLLKGTRSISKLRFSEFEQTSSSSVTTDVSIIARLNKAKFKFKFYISSSYGLSAYLTELQSLNNK